MSAWLCSAKHISAIVSGASGTAEDFKILLAENLRSLEARYSDCEEWKAAAKTYAFVPVSVSATQLIKCCDSYDYQACETDDYDTSAARAYVDKVRQLAIARGGKESGARYDAADWGL